MSKVAAMSERHCTRPASRLQVDYCRIEELRRRPPDGWQNVLAVVRFDAGAERVVLDGVPVVDVSSPVLRIAAPASSNAHASANGNAGSSSGGNAGADAEVWSLSGPMSSGQLGRLSYRRNGQLLFATVTLREEDFPRADPAEALRAATLAAYGELFEGIERLGFPHPLRIWHFLPAINAPLGDSERYWHFNSARQSAFLSAQRSIRGNVPAASAVGTAAGTPLTIYCIAGLNPPIVLENPRQCSSWAYPPQYGPNSPTFARACIEPAVPAHTLFLSGTASIVGHESAHAGDAAEQTRETLRNIAAVLQAANARLATEQPGCAPFNFARLHYKVYVRRPQDQPRVEQVLRDQAAIATPVLYLQADLCRSELLVEIEASGICGDG
jgi:hypothetical protein